MHCKQLTATNKKLFDVKRWLIGRQTEARSQNDQVMSFGFPRAHLVAVALLCIGLWSFGLSDFENDQQAPQASTTGTAVPLAVKSSDDNPPDFSIKSTDERQALTEPRLEQPGIDLDRRTRLGDNEQVARSPIPTIEHKVRRGDSLSAVFQRYGLSASLLHELATSKPHGARLRSILPGKTPVRRNETLFCSARRL